MKKLIFLKIVLVLTGVYVVASGLNIAAGGMLTLGWGGSKDFFTVTDQKAYLIQDSHVRFVGGVWLALGLFFIWSVTNVYRYLPQLLFACILVFVGGLCRLFQPDGATFHMPVLGSFLAELIGMPVLFIWLKKTVR